MKLSQFVASPDGMTVGRLVELLRKTRVGKRVSAVQLRQWIHGYGGRVPGAAYCVAIEAVTAGAVTRRDLRPDDWQDIWPEHEEAERLRTVVAELLQRLRRYEPDAAAVLPELAGHTHTPAPRGEPQQEVAHV